MSMPTITKAAAALLSIVLISAVACGSDQSSGDIVAEPEPTATATAGPAEPQADLSDQTMEMDEDTGTDTSDQAVETVEDTGTDASDQAMVTVEDTGTDTSDQAMEMDEDPEPDLSDQTMEMDEDPEPDLSDQTMEMDEDPEPDLSDQSTEMDEDPEPDLSDQAVVTVEEAGDDTSDQAVVTVEEAGDDTSDQAVVTVEEAGTDGSDQAVVTVDDIGTDTSDQSTETAGDAGGDSSDQTMETVDEEPEPGENETVKVGRDVGERVLEFSITLEDGTVLTTQDLLSDGRPVFIYFFTTWCPVCRRDLTELQAIYPEYAEAVYFIVVGQDPTEPLGELVAYRNGRGQDWPVALAGPRMLADLRITSQAFKLAFDSGGIITYRAGYRDGDPDVWRGVIADLASG